MRRFSIPPVILAVLTLAVQPAGWAQNLAALQAQDAAVATIGFRLSQANAALCDTRYAAGLTPHYLNQYGSAHRVAAAGAFALSDLPSVLAVARGAPADRAGIRANDRLIAVDGEAFKAGPDRGPDGSFADSADALDRLDRAAADGTMLLTIERGGSRTDVRIDPVRACRSRFQIVTGDEPVAQADGAYVQISAGMAAFARGDSELASVLAHELAHNILRHRVKLEAQGAFGKGLFGPGARNARLIRATEIEADRLSPYLMAAAGYDPRDAVRYWQRRGAARGDRLLRAGTHPKWRERVKIIGEEVARIERAAAAGERIAIPPDLDSVLRRERR